MPVQLTRFILGVLIVAPSLPVHAQAPKFDSATVARANKPILRTGELIGVLATTGVAMALDQTLRNTIYDPHDRFGRSVSDLGNAMGNGLYIYPSLLALAVAGKAFGSPGLYGVSSRALKSGLLAGAGAVVLKAIVGRERPAADNAFKFHPFTTNNKWSSFPSGHTTLAFSVATSFAREIDGSWDDVAFYSLATITAYARMHDDRHWMSDVVFGAGVGILSARFIHRREAKLLLGKNLVGASLGF